MKTDVSKAMSRSIPEGNAALIFGSSLFTARATDSVLAVDCFTIPMPTAGLPLTRTMLRSSCGPNSARPTSLKRTG